MLLGISFLLHTVIRFVSGEMRCSRQGGGHVHYYVLCCCPCCCLLLLVMVTHTLGLSRDAAFVGYSERYLGRQSSSLENHGSFACLCSSPNPHLSCAMLSLCPPNIVRKHFAFLFFSFCLSLMNCLLRNCCIVSFSSRQPEDP